MDLSKFSTALTPVNLADTTDITITPQFTVKVCQMVNYNQVYMAKMSEFSQKFPKHQFVKDFKSFIGDWYDAKQTPDTVSFMAHVILCGWELLDNDGNAEPFSAQSAITLLNAPVGRAIFGKIANAVHNDALFQMAWSDDAVKNS